jgi:hypothetical protein
VLGRIKASLEDPISLEKAGHALFDMYPERRGNLFGDEVCFSLHRFFGTLDPGGHVQCSDHFPTRNRFIG